MGNGGALARMKNQVPGGSQPPVQSLGVAQAEITSARQHACVSTPCLTLCFPCPPASAGRDLSGLLTFPWRVSMICRSGPPETALSVLSDGPGA